VLFETNQGTDEHLVRTPLAKVVPYSSVKASGAVASVPDRIPGGHVIFSISGGGATLDCAAYEPTKEFRDIVQQLIPGDRVEAWGGVREPEPGRRLTINLEKLRPVRLVEHRVKAANPRCPKCKRGMKSVGAGQGYRCRDCGVKASESAASYKTVPRALKLTIYEVPICARRHLHKPLKRYD